MQPDVPTSPPFEPAAAPPFGAAQPKPWQRWLRRFLMVVLLGYVGWRLSQIGWRDLIAHLPLNPWFYALQLAGFTVLPLVETFAFRTIWKQRLPAAPIALLKKRALNNVVFGLSGDAYFYFWARGRAGRPDRQLLAGLKDNVLLSGAATGTATVIMAAIMAGLYGPKVIGDLAGGHYGLAFGGLCLLVGVGVLGWVFRRRVLWIDARSAAIVLGLHTLRLVLTLSLLGLQWQAGLPGGSITLWATLIAVQLLVSQLPLIPNRDLVFLAIVIQIAHSTGLDSAGLQTMFLTIAVLSQILNYASLIGTGLIRSADSVMPTGAVAAPPE